MNNFFKVLFALSVFVFLFGCTSQDILLVRQSIGADVNGFFDGNYDKGIPFVDVNTITFDPDFNFDNGTLYVGELGGDLNWSNLQNYPSACPSGTAVQSIGDTLTCVSLSDTNGFVTWIDANATFATIINLNDLNSYVYSWGDFNNDLNYLQIGDNVSDLNNDAGYITSGDIPSFNDTNVYTAGLVSNDNNNFLIDLNVYKTNPQLVLTDSVDDGYARLYKTNSSNAFYLYNVAEAPASGGQSLVLNGSTTFVSLGDFQDWDDVGTGNFTISTWFKTESTANSNMRIFESYNTSSPFNGVTFQVNPSTDTVKVWTANSGASTLTSSSTNINDGAWHNVQFKRTTSTTLELWVDGVKVANTGSANNDNVSQDTTVANIGRSPAFGGYFDGEIDEMAFWSRALTDGETGDIYNSGSGLYLDITNNFASSGTSVGNDVIAIWHFNNSLIDDGGNNNGSGTDVSYGTGLISNPGTDTEIQIIKSVDGIESGEEGVTTFGHDGGKTEIQGGTGIDILDNITTNIVIDKSSPELRLIEDDGSDYFSRVYRTSNETFYIKSETGIPSSTPYAIERTGSDNGNPFDSAITLDGAFTISIWFWADVDNKSLLGGASTGDYAIINYTSADLYIRSDSGGGSALGFDFAGGVNTGQWNHLTVTRDGSNNVRAYLNNVESTTGAQTKTNDYVYSYLGSQGPTIRDWDGKLDQTAIWERLLTSDERGDIYNGGTGWKITGNFPSTGTPVNTSAVAIWEFEEGSGNTVQDSGPVGNDITISGTATWVTGKVPNPSSVSEVTVLTVSEGVDQGQEGTIILGNDTSDTRLNGGEVNFEVDGVVEWSIDESGDLISENNSDLKIKSDTAKLIFGLDDDWEVYSDGTRLYVDRPSADSDVIFSGGSVGIGVTSASAKLDVVQNNASYAIIAGSDLTATSRTNNTRKALRFGVPHYTNAEQPVLALLADIDSSFNNLKFGGGSSVGNAATNISFLTAGNTTTTVGTERMFINSDGDVKINQDLNVDGTVYYGALQSLSPHAFLSDDGTGTRICKQATDGVVLMEKIEKVNGEYKVVYYENQDECNKILLKSIDVNTGLFVVDGVPSEVVTTAKVYEEIWSKEQNVVLEEVINALPLYDVNKYYLVGDIFRYDGETYEVVQEHQPQSSWTPDLVPALYKVKVLQEYGEIREWVQPIGASDCYALGDKVTYGGNTWESTVACNVWQPGIFGWVVI